MEQSRRYRAHVDPYEKTRPQILVVHKSDLVLRILRGMLGKLGYEAVAATSPKLAMDHLLPRHDFAALIADCDPTRMTGIQLLATLRAQQIPIPTLLLTSTDDQVDGAPNLEKPFTGAQLAVALGRLGVVVHTEHQQQVTSRIDSQR